MINDLISRLHPDHLADLRKSGLSNETIFEANIKSVEPDDIDKVFGYPTHAKSAYEIIYPGTDYARYKMFYDEADKINPKTGEVLERPKYLCKKGSGNHLYIPNKVQPILKDLSIPLYLSEGEKKALKGCQEGLYCIAIAGLWNWSNGGKELISDFDLIALDGRAVYVVPDSHFQEPDRYGRSKNLKQAVYELAYRLIDRGVKVCWIGLPKGDIEIKLDDYLCEHTVEDFKKLLSHPIRKLTIQEAIDNMNAETPFEEIKEILKRITEVTYESEKTDYINKLAEKKGISVKDLRRDLKTLTENTTQNTTCENIIAHPAYDINPEFLSLGYKEIIVAEGKIEDRNFFIVSTNGQYCLCEGTTLQINDKQIVFDIRERVLLGIGERWNKHKLTEFINSPSSPKGLYNEIKGVLKQYVELQKEEHYGLVAAWIISTYFHRLFNAMPFLFFYGKKQSGKSRGLDINERLAFNGIKVKGVSVASLADSIDGIRATFLNDQAESLSNPKNEEILGIIADSYTSGGGKRRIVHISNKTRRVMEFETYSPKAFASIKDIDSDLKDRCILIPMLRATREYPYPEAHLAIWGDLRDKLYRLLLTKWEEAREIYQTAGDGVSHRIKELWRPIETILKLESVSGEEINSIKTVFLESMQETQAELSDQENELFEALFVLLKNEKEKKLTVSDIAIEIQKQRNEGMNEAELLKSLKNERGLQTWVGKIITQLSLYGKRAGKLKNKHAYLFTNNHVQEIFERYQTSGTSGKVANTAIDKGFETATLENASGNKWHDGNSKGGILPPHATSSKTGGNLVSLENQGKCYFATSATENKGIKKEVSEIVDSEIPEVEFIEEVKTNV